MDTVDLLDRLDSLIGDLADIEPLEEGVEYPDSSYNALRADIATKIFIEMLRRPHMNAFSDPVTYSKNAVYMADLLMGVLSDKLKQP